MITANNISFDFGGRTLYSNASFDINPKERIGIVGRNGTGKSTLLRIITRQYTPGAGVLSFQKNLKIGFFNQDLLSFETSDSLQNVVLQAFEPILQKLQEVEDIANLLATDYSEELLHKLSDVQDFLNINDAYTLEIKVQKALTGLGFADHELSKPYSSFSGGWRMRAMLAKCILEQPDVLMLDEPTNHLDLPAIQWIEQYLVSFEGTIIVVSHDRHFLNRICTKIVEIENRKMTTYTGNFDEYIEQKEEQGELLEKAFKNQQDKIKQDERFIERFKAKASKAKAAQSRMKLLDKIERIQLPDGDIATMNIKLKVAVQPGRRLYEIKNAFKSFPHIELLKNAEAMVERGDKIALIGANGKGKSTVLRMLFGSEPFEGERTEGHNVKTAFFAQHQLESLNAELNILDELMYSNTSKTEMELRAVLGAFLFTGDDVFKKIKVLSGGERSRVALAKIIISDANFLLLDEPTNHLDMQSVEILIQALQQYEGSYIAISHDRYFLSQIANKIWWIDEPKSLRSYGGNYDEYELWFAQQRVEATKKSADKSPKVEAKTAIAAPKANQNKPNRHLLQKQFDDLELEIENLKKQKFDIETQLALPSVYNDPTKSKTLAEQLRQIGLTTKAKNQDWEQIFMQLEA